MRSSIIKVQARPENSVIVLIEILEIRGFIVRKVVNTLKISVASRHTLVAVLPSDTYGHEHHGLSIPADFHITCRPAENDGLDCARTSRGVSFPCRSWPAAILSKLLNEKSGAVRVYLRSHGNATRMRSAVVHKLQSFVTTRIYFHVYNLRFPILARCSGSFAKPARHHILDVGTSIFVPVGKPQARYLSSISARPLSQLAIVRSWER